MVSSTTLLHAEPLIVLNSFLGDAHDGFSQTVIQSISDTHKISLWSSAKGLVSFAHALLEIRADEVEDERTGAKTHSLVIRTVDVQGLSPEHIAIVNSLTRQDSTQLSIRGDVLLSKAPFSQTEMKSFLEIEAEHTSTSIVR